MRKELSNKTELPTAYVRTPLCIQSFDTSMLALVNSHLTSGLQWHLNVSTFISLHADGLHWLVNVCQ